MYGRHVFLLGRVTGNNILFLFGPSACFSFTLTWVIVIIVSTHVRSAASLHPLDIFRQNRNGQEWPVPLIELPGPTFTTLANSLVQSRVIHTLKSELEFVYHAKHLFMIGLSYTYTVTHNKPVIDENVYGFTASRIVMATEV